MKHILNIPKSTHETISNLDQNYVRTGLALIEIAAALNQQSTSVMPDDLIMLGASGLVVFAGSAIGAEVVQAGREIIQVEVDLPQLIIDFATDAATIRDVYNEAMRILNNPKEIHELDYKPAFSMVHMGLSIINAIINAHETAQLTNN